MNSTENGTTHSGLATTKIAQLIPDRPLAQHAGTIRVLHTLRPFAVAMAGEAEFDPFKD
jgi:hypothetical protein